MLMRGWSEGGMTGLFSRKLQDTMSVVGQLEESMTGVLCAGLASCGIR